MDFSRQLAPTAGSLSAVLSVRFRHRFYRMGFFREYYIMSFAVKTSMAELRCLSVTETREDDDCCIRSVRRRSQSTRCAVGQSAKRRVISWPLRAQVSAWQAGCPR